MFRLDHRPVHEAVARTEERCAQDELASRHVVSRESTALIERRSEAPPNTSQPRGTAGLLVGSCVVDSGDVEHPCEPVGAACSRDEAVVGVEGTRAVHGPTVSSERDGEGTLIGSRIGAGQLVEALTKETAPYIWPLPYSCPIPAPFAALFVVVRPEHPNRPSSSPFRAQEAELLELNEIFAERSIRRRVVEPCLDVTEGQFG